MELRILLLIPVALLPASLAAPHYEATGKIGVLAIGDTSIGESPILQWLATDFAVQWQELPTDVDGVMGDIAARKIVRIYTPRTLEKLLESYDILLLLEPRMWFTDTEIRMFTDSIDLGVSTLLTLWPDIRGYISLVYSELAQVYPHDFWPSYQSGGNQAYVVKVKEGNLPVLTPFIPLGIEEFPGKGTRPIHPKQGSITWAWAIKSGIGGSERDEYMISWEYGESEARNWVIGVDVDEQWFNPGAGNKYGGDIILNMLYYSAGKPLPHDLGILLGIRAAFYRYTLEKRLLFTVIEFVDSFGANTQILEQKLSEADDGKESAVTYYLEGDYVASFDKTMEMIEYILVLNEEAIRVKERALLWVYMTEWSVVSGANLLVGFVLYTLMVKRRLYREVQVTRSVY